MELILFSLAHLLVDAVCAATLFSITSGNMFTLVAVYNTIAFSTQALTGLMVDKTGRCRTIAASSCGLIAIVFFVPAAPMFKAIAVGLGNSLFHVSAGAHVLKGCYGKAKNLGVFVAPGCVGLSLGTMFPKWGYAFSLALILVSALTLILVQENREKQDSEQCEISGSLISAVTLLLVAVTVRSIGGTAVSFPWVTTPALSLILTLFIFAGKTSGGFVLDKFGAERTALFSIPLAAVFISFFSGNMVLSMVGQLLLNLTMPLTLYLIFKALPERPGFAFGLAASVLWPGALIGRSIGKMAENMSWYVFLCFAIGFAAVMLSIKNLNKFNSGGKT